MGEKQDDEETWGLEGRYSSDRGLSRHSVDFHCGKLGEIRQMRVRENRKKKGKTLRGRMKGVHN
jgi:hypothetical protein